MGLEIITYASEKRSLWLRIKSRQAILFSNILNSFPGLSISHLVSVIMNKKIITLI